LATGRTGHNASSPPPSRRSLRKDAQNVSRHA
jgi:hypothetical protein